MKRQVLLLGVLFLAFASPARAEVRYTVTDLSAIWEASFPEPQRVKTWYASAINNHGQIAGYAETTDNSVFALVWDESNSLRDFSDPDGASWTYTINNLGQIAIEGSTPRVWDSNAGFREIIGWGSGPVRPIDMNDLGQVVGVHPVDSGGWHAFLWQDGQMRDLGTLGGKQSYANAINNLGQIVGDDETHEWVHAFSWDTEDGMRDLGSFGRRSLAMDINDLGEVVGYSEYVEGGAHACLWQDGHMIDIDPLGNGSSALAINNRGQILGAWDSPDGEESCFLWNSMDGICDINDLLPADSDWEIVSASAINDAGWIVGAARKDIGAGYAEPRAVLLRPVPEASGTILLVSIAGMVMARLLLSRLRDLTKGDR